MKKIILFLLSQFSISSLLLGAYTRTNKTSIINQVISQFSFNYSDTIYCITSAPENTYGYEIIINNKVLIKQQTIPARQGFQRFKRKSDTAEVAALVLAKLKRGQFPPSIDEKDKNITCIILN